MIYLYIKENVISCSSAITEKADNKLLFQQNNLKEQRFIDEHKLKVNTQYKLAILICCRFNYVV